MECIFRKAPRKGKASDKDNKRTSKKASNEKLDHHDSTRTSNERNATSARKRKQQLTPDADDELDGFVGNDDIDDLEYGIEDFASQLRQVNAQASEPEDDDWTFSMSASSRVKKKPRIGGRVNKAREAPEKIVRDDGEIITLLSD